MGQISRAIGRAVQHVPLKNYIQRLPVVPRAYNRLIRQNSLRRVTFSTPAGQMEMQLPADEGFLSRKAGEEGGHEPFMAADLGQFLDGDSVFVDVGAHCGYFTVYPTLLGVSPERIHAFEADEFYFQMLCENCPDSHCTHGFVSDETTEDSIALDDYFAEDGRGEPDVAKIDAEGAELDVLSGFSETIERCHPVMYIEIHPDLMESFGARPRDVYERLREEGYDIRACLHTRDEYPLDDGRDVWTPVGTESPVDHIHGIRAVRGSQ